MKNVIWVLSWLLLVLPCAAEIIIVDEEWPYDFNDIQAAIDYSDNGNGDIIVVFPGTYHGNYEGIDFRGKAVTVTSVDPHDPYIVAATIIEPPVYEGEFNGHHSGHYGRGFYLGNNEGPDSVIDGLTIRNCSYYDGAAIHCNGSSPTISNCIITGNNSYGQGGGIYCEGGSPQIINCVITANASQSGNGGGIYFYGCLAPTIANCAFNGNSASNGGGIYLEEVSSSADISNSCFTANTAQQDGGAIYSCHSGPPITNCTFTRNLSGNKAGGIFLYYDNLLSLTNSVLWANIDSTGTNQSAQITYEPPSALPPEVLYSCIQDDNPDDTDVPFGGVANGNIDDEPMFARYPDDGGDGWGDDPGTTHTDEGANDDFGDLHLLKNSPCINAGVPNFLIQPSVVDMDGQPRVLGGRVDIGADEAAPIIVVTEPADGDVYTSGSIHDIKWDSYGIGNVDIALSKNPGGTRYTIETALPDTGSYSWHLPDIVDSSQCIILVVPSVPDSNFICIESGLFTIHPDNPDAAAESKWKSLGGDFSRTGLSTNIGPQTGCIKWQFETDRPVSASVTIGAGDRLHIACEDGKLYTLDADGNPVWTYDTNSPLLSSPTVGPDGSLYVGSDNGKLYAISASGILRWTHSTSGFIYSSPAVSEQGNIYVGSQDGTLYALALDGSQLWTFKTNGFGRLDGSILAPPAIAPDGTVYIGALYDPNLYALDGDTGSVKWICNFEYVTDAADPANNTKRPWPFAAPVIGPDGTIYQSLLFDPNLYAIDPNNGSIIWSTNLADPWSGWFDSEYDRDPDPRNPDPTCLPVPGDYCKPGAYYAYNYRHPDGWSEPALGPDGTIYVSFDDPYLRAVDPNGSIKWVTQLGTLGGFTLTVADNNLIYAAGDDGCIYVLDSKGRQVTQLNSSAWLNFPVIAADKTIIVADSKDNTMFITDANNTVWAISPENCKDKPFRLFWLEDLSADGFLDLADLALLAENWLDCTDTDWPCFYQGTETYLTGDIDKDKYVNFADFAALATRWLMQE